MVLDLSFNMIYCMLMFFHRKRKKQKTKTKNKQDINRAGESVTLSFLYEKKKKKSLTVYRILIYYWSTWYNSHGAIHCQLLSDDFSTSFLRTTSQVSDTGPMVDWFENRTLWLEEDRRQTWDNI